MAGPDFSQKTVDALAKRAAQTCSKPSCREATSGPHSEASKSVVKGEAAHIRGARPGSARYDPSTTDEERAHAANGIWLCRECARVVDLDEARYPVDLLLKWKAGHEDWVEAGRPITSPSEPLLDLELGYIQCESLRSTPPADLTFSFKFHVDNSSALTASKVQLGLISWSQKTNEKRLPEHLRSLVDIEDNATDRFYMRYRLSYVVAPERPTIEPFGSVVIELHHAMTWPYYHKRRRFASAIYLLSSESPPIWFQLRHSAYVDYLAWSSDRILPEVELGKLSSSKPKVGVIDEDWHPQD